ncbi:zinc finger protein 84-like [Penaeus monodon]|uniref:zinc finger protein 84-like n=1 Tax=Penaeus monodon TaxID=6687 RepID=UPI0018A709E7|nr:zinc finger protein 84-like [Penaeus monodon]
MVNLMSNLTMSFLYDWMPLAPLTDKEIFGIRVSIKEEFNEDVSEETCVDIKEEPFEYTDEDFGKKYISDRDQATNDESYKDATHGKVDGKFVAEKCENKWSSNEDQATYNENYKEVTNGEMRAELTRIVGKMCYKKVKPINFNDKPYSMICNKALSDTCNIIRHMRVHTKENPYICEICSKAFSRKSHLMEHIRIHTKEKPYSCKICNKTFRSRSRLVNHTRIHTNKRPYSCDICIKAFSEKGNQISGKSHRIHTNVKSCSCEICNKTFSSNSGLVRQNGVHTKEICKKVCSEEGILVKHDSTYNAKVIQM